ncbi:hypothetical protein D2M30_0894 [Bacillus amyloliquefaciens]|nr:hypothetical protein D2M30_0894 [Bacillus amyloliquefaciens]
MNTFINKVCPGYRLFLFFLISAEKHDKIKPYAEKIFLPLVTKKGFKRH